MLSKFDKRLQAAGYCCQRDLDLRPASATLYACKDVRWFCLPFDVNYYVFDFDDAPVDLVEVEGFEAIARDRTRRDRFRSPYPWYRSLGVAVSNIILVCRGGFTDEASLYVRTRSTLCFGHVSTVILVEPKTMELVTLRRIPILGCATICRAIQEAVAFVRESFVTCSYDSIT